MSAVSDDAALALVPHHSPIVMDGEKPAFRAAVQQTNRSTTLDDGVKCPDCETDYGVTEWIERDRLGLHRREHHWPGKCVVCASFVNDRDTEQYRKHRVACPEWLALVKRGLHWQWLCAMPEDELEARRKQFFTINQRAAAKRTADGDEALLQACFKRYIDDEVRKLSLPVSNKKQRAAPFANSSAGVIVDVQPLPAADELAVTTTSSSDDPEVPNAPVDTFVDRASGVYAESFKGEGGYHPHADIDEDVWSAAAEVDEQWNPRTPLVHVRLL